MNPETKELPAWATVLVVLVYTLPIWGLLLTLITGKIAERRHYKRIQEREAKWVHVPAITCKHVPGLRQERGGFHAKLDVLI